MSFLAFILVPAVFLILVLLMLHGAASTAAGLEAAEREESRDTGYLYRVDYSIPTFKGNAKQRRLARRAYERARNKVAAV